MSGRKYSQVELAVQVHEAIRCRMEAEQALAAAASLAVALAEAAQTVGALQDAARAAERTLAELHGEIEAMRETFSEASLMRLDATQVRERREHVDELRRQIAAVTLRCREGGSAAGVRVEAARLVEHLARHREALRPWLGQEYDELAALAAAALAATDREIRSTGAASGVASQIRSLDECHEQMIARVAERREQDADRWYIAEALLSICKADLGFAGRILPRETPIDDLVVEVDTFAYGLLHFRLLLDGTIRSRSELMETSCPASFEAIEKGLRSLGVLSSFRYEDDQRPVVITQDAKPAPGETLAAEKRRL